jgi:hypothetical protein
MTSLPWATRIATCLAGHRRDGRTFEQAWRAALTSNPPNRHGDDGWQPSTLKFAEQAFRAGYKRAHSLGTTLNLEHRLFTDPHLAAPVAIERRCGWGGGCNSESMEGRHLCATHSKRVRSIFALCLHPSCHSEGAPNLCAGGEDYCPSHGGPPVPRTQACRQTAINGNAECVTPGCKRTAQGLRCARHSKKVAA